MLRRLLPEHIAIVLELEQTPWTTRVDPSHFEQVIVNLVVNARDAMPNGGRLRLATRNVVLEDPAAEGTAELRPGTYVALDVEDTGVGMDAATIGQIFEPFFTTKLVGQGTGLGLSMCFGIVKQAGGHIVVRSEPGRGSRFTVLLPRFEGAAATAAATGVGPPVRPRSRADARPSWWSRTRSRCGR